MFPFPSKQKIILVCLLHIFQLRYRISLSPPPGMLSSKFSSELFPSSSASSSSLSLTPLEDATESWIRAAAGVSWQTFSLVGFVFLDERSKCWWFISRCEPLFCLILSVVTVCICGRARLALSVERESGRSCDSGRDGRPIRSPKEALGCFGEALNSTHIHLKRSKFFLCCSSLWPLACEDPVNPNSSISNEGQLWGRRMRGGSAVLSKSSWTHRRL